jgi:DNA-binding response OmpR family regulator
LDPSSGRVLIVDDDPGIVDVVEAVLIEEGFEVFSALDGEEALEAVSTHRPEVVLLDVMMPRVDGLEICRRIRNNPSTSHMCVIMLTARTFPADRLMGLGEGADDYITKPFDPVDLSTRIRTSLRRSQEVAPLSPLTRLPGGRQFEEMERRLQQEGGDYAVMRIDLVGFTAFNERYGTLRGDMAIRRVAASLVEVIADAAGSRGFAGHLGGDDFVAIVDAGVAESAARRLEELWGERVADVYDSKDAGAGYIEIVRSGRSERFPLMELSVEVDVCLGSPTPRAGAGRAEAAELERSPLLRRSRRGGPTKLWDDLAALSAGHRLRKKIWLTEAPNTVLIVGDEEDVRGVLRLHCEIQGFPVVGEAVDGGEAVTLVGELLPAFVILDHRMREMDGEEAATRIRAIHPEVKIIAFSGVLTERPSWADDFLSKEQIAQMTPLLGRFLDMGAAAYRRRR